MAGGGPAAGVSGAPGTPGAPGAPGLSGDPVREVMAEHRLLCERAVDPLEIAVGLEEAGLGQEAAARCRHADLFGLAEELYARVPRRPPAPPAAGEADPGAAGNRQRNRGAALRASVLTVLPVAAAAALGGRWPVLLPAAVPLALLPALPALPVEPVPSGPCATAGPELGPSAALLPEVPHPAGPRRWRPAVLGHGAGVAGLLLLPLAGAAGGPGDGRVTAALVLAAALSAGSAEWAARWFRHVGGGHLRTAGTLAEFRARMRPVLPVAVALHLAVLTVLSFAALAVLTALAPRPGPGHGGGLLHLAAERAGPAQWAAQGVLGLLLVLTALPARCGRHRAAALGALAGSAAAAVPLVLGRSAPVAGLLGGGAVALALLAYAWPALGRAGAHR
ncbi:hypothetical protein [Streptomyces sp. CB01881]|uniref:hypothetical protein n=1 Tax=Streptomyces sp. CB01881 TaxID=2078691 RepID=UPI000CDBEBF4|nr:hypothetical protein [Streptomyces sp. CB01881]AUY49935.1 hypothetical protein C2142_14530 [Streptomyces sp. CB01881]TYC73333.1 hypothetical protein EH183_14515 [Streptomyces sp. CB01881]